MKNLIIICSIIMFVFWVWVAGMSVGMAIGVTLFIDVITVATYIFVAPFGRLFN